MTPFILGIATGLTSMSMLCAYLWREWSRSHDELYTANLMNRANSFNIEAVRGVNDDLQQQIASLRCQLSLADTLLEAARGRAKELLPLATMGAKKRAKDARYRARAKGK